MKRSRRRCGRWSTRCTTIPFSLEIRATRCTMRLREKHSAVQVDGERSRSGRGLHIRAMVLRVAQSSTSSWPTACASSPRRRRLPTCTDLSKRDQSQRGAQCRVDRRVAVVWERRVALLVRQTCHSWKRAETPPCVRHSVPLLQDLQHGVSPQTIPIR